MKPMYWILIGLTLAAAIATALLFISARRSSGPLSPAEVEKMLRRKLEASVSARKGSPAALVAVDAPGLNLDIRLSAGEANTDSLFHSASVGKLHTAAAIMALADRGELFLNDRLGDLIDTSPWQGMLVVDGEDRLAGLTVEQLMTHTTGLADFFEDKTRDGEPNLYKLIISEPERIWTIESRLAYTRDHFDPVGRPGDYHYSDTNYDFLGLVIEAVTGKAFDEARWNLVLEPAGVEDSGAWPPAGWKGEALPMADDGGLVPLIVDGIDLAGAPSLSIDGPGGGLAVTLNDQVRFMRSLVEGSAFPLLEDFHLLDGKWGRFNRGMDYGRGLMVIRPGRLTPFMKGYPNLYGHSGITGSYLYYLPEYDAVIAGSFNNTAWGRSRHVIFLLEVVNLLGRLTGN